MPLFKLSRGERNEKELTRPELVKQDSNTSTDTAITVMTASQGEDLQIRFKDINYDIEIKKNGKIFKKPILKGVSGVFKEGSLTVILGSSGAGKTSLLNIIV